MDIYLMFVDTARNSNKFWSGRVENNSVTVQWGRVGYQAQIKVHQFSTYQQAVSKFNSLVAEKRAKGYRESQPEVTSDRSISEIRQAIQLLNNMRPFVASTNFDDNFVRLLDEYLKIIPTPLGMQIDYSKVYRTEADINHQEQLLNSLVLMPSPQPATATIDSCRQVDNADTKIVSIKTISKNFWRHL